MYTIRVIRPREWQMASLDWMEIMVTVNYVICQENALEAFRALAVAPIKSSAQRLK